ncbi:MAG: hypothetical protein R3E50_12420 [Halioglobus sp.]
MKQLLHFALIVLLGVAARVSAAPPPQPDLRAITPDGQQVLLKSDHTWEFVELEPGDPSNSAVLSVVSVREMQDACGLDFRLLNNFGAKIHSLVPRISVYNKEGVLFDSASLSFASLRPTQDKYTKIQFTGIGCRDISSVRVTDAAHCRMGEIDMFNEKEGECLSHIYVEPSQDINISK